MLDVQLLPGNQADQVELQKAIRQRNPKESNVDLVLDYAADNKTSAVKELASQLSIELLSLLPDSPNLNPIERLWRNMKLEILANSSSGGLDEFRTAVTNYFRNLRLRKPIFRSLITMNFDPVGN